MTVRPRTPCSHAVDDMATMPAMPRLPPLEPIKAALRALDSTTQPSSIPFPPLAPPSRSPYSSPAPTSSPVASLKTAQKFITIAPDTYSKVVALGNSFPTHLTTPQSELRGERNRPRKPAVSGGRRRPSTVGSSSDDLRVPRVPDVHAPCTPGPGSSWAGPTSSRPQFELNFRFIFFPLFLHTDAVLEIE